MHIAIIGLPQSGKSSFFKLITTAFSVRHDSSAKDAHLAAIKIADARLDDIAASFSSKKISHAEIILQDTNCFKKAAQGLAIEQAQLKDAEGFICILRGFRDQIIIHPFSSVSPARDFNMILSEFILADEVAISTRLDKISKEMEKGRKENEQEASVLRKYKEHVASGRPLWSIQESPDEERLVRGFKFLSARRELAILNIGEEELGKPIDAELLGAAAGLGINILAGCIKDELELQELDEQDRSAFMKELGVKEFIADKFFSFLFSAMGILTFFSANQNEAKAHLVKAGASAIACAGKIHADMERGFIKAEVINYADFKNCGLSMQEARSKGLLRLEAKEYRVKDGDIINFKFSV